VLNHIPMCSCPSGMTGNAFVQCSPQRGIQKIENVFLQNIFISLTIAPVETNPCQPSPCGPNSQCRAVNGQAVCTCVQGYIGNPPACRPECSVNSDCGQAEACHNFKCRDPCPGTCGIGAKCMVINHNPICSCPQRYAGDPFVQCSPVGNNSLLRQNSMQNSNKLCIVLPLVERPVVQNAPTDPCRPSPCGPNSNCVNRNGSPSCSCLPNMIGAPPNCRPECVTHSDCPNDKACANQRCVDPCIGACGLNAECRVSLHIANCICRQGYTGDPFTNCYVYCECPPFENRVLKCVIYVSFENIFN
jgi:hypothetical protein